MVSSAPWQTLDLQRILATLWDSSHVHSVHVFLADTTDLQMVC